MTARTVAFRVLQRIEDQGAYSHIALSHELEASELSGSDRGFATHLVYGTLAWRRAIDAIISQAATRNLDAIDPVVLRVLRLATYQLMFMRVPDHAAVDQAVEYVKKVRPDATSFANGVLRSVSKNKTRDWWKSADREKKPVRYIGERYSLPNWIANRLIQQLGLEEAEKAAEGFAQIAPIWIRDRTGKMAASDTVRSGPISGAFEGDFSSAKDALKSGDAVVQDLGAQYAVLACSDVEGKKVLDLCAGLGGKSLFLADRGAHVTAVEPHKKRLDILTHDRVTAVVSTAQEFQSTELFDVVLVDAPCTGLGVLRRHPETRWRKREADISSLAPIQKEILDAAVKFVKPGGVMLYCVCTFTREETSKQIEKFLERHDRFALQPFEIDGALQCESGFVQLWPHRHPTDGFFIAKLRLQDA